MGGGACSGAATREGRAAATRLPPTLVQAWRSAHRGCSTTPHNACCLHAVTQGEAAARQNRLQAHLKRQRWGDGAQLRAMGLCQPALHRKKARQGGLPLPPAWECCFGVVPQRGHSLLLHCLWWQ